MPIPGATVSSEYSNVTSTHTNLFVAISKPPLVTLHTRQFQIIRDTFTFDAISSASSYFVILSALKATLEDNDLIIELTVAS